ncbi:MAG TPA: hypothetical protein VFD73_10260, partial [Gemmatimonadales bacterium]|nr:hypothetical protein [Gemmatimonadales bacterium]
QVRWHYQWMLVTDYLPKIVNSGTYAGVFADPRNPIPGLPELEHGLRLMPVEFSVAAFRFGHSMIRPLYRLNTTIERRPIFLPGRYRQAQADDAADLRGFRPVPADWAIDWQFFIDLEHTQEPRTMPPPYDQIAREPQHAYKIDTSLVSPLHDLPRQIASGPSILALRNLERGQTFSLPTGQQAATALSERVIPDERLVIGKATAGDTKKPIARVAGSFAGQAPLWAYILSEAQVTSWENAGPGLSPDKIPVKLGPVGGRIVAGVFAALLQRDRTSYLSNGTAFAPIPDFCRGEKFGLAELINVALRPRPRGR